MSEFICVSCHAEYDEVPEDSICFVCGSDCVFSADWYEENEDDYWDE